MKKFCVLISIGLAFPYILFAAPKYWVGPSNGTWSNTAHWSSTANGSGSAGVPLTNDSVIFTSGALVWMDVSPTVTALNIQSVDATVKLYAASPITLTILSTLIIGLTSTLKDSTSANVPFNTILNGPTRAQGFVAGSWQFEGRVSPTECSSICVDFQ